MEITYAISTFPGEREQNEDYAISGKRGDVSCFAVADGLGGHGRGEVASRLVCETAMRRFAEGGALEELFETAQRELMEKQKQERAIDAMKTTLNLLTVGPGEICWGHVGDTRTYYFKHNKLVCRTKDHSVPQMMVTMGEIKEEEIRHHADRNRLLRVMGIEWRTPQYVLEKALKPRKRQAFCMCTDGFWEYIEEKDMEKCLKTAGTVQEWLDAMNDVVKKNGAGEDMDNYTALAVWIG
ncbi:MAG: protein phosphatase 2C domain-containing protein [bacterium]|nr:protein phosphatase 2C domain-containing protein [bacterium]